MNVVSPSLIRVSSLEATYSGIISGSGTLSKVGNGLLTLNGTSPYSGTINISSGALSVNGNLPNATAVAILGTKLEGSGFINNAQVYGTISPGNSIGTIHGTTFHLFGGSTYIDEIGESGITDLISAPAGTITVDPGVTLNVVPVFLSPLADSTYIIAQAESVVGSSFSSILFPYKGFQPHVNFFPNYIELTFTINPFASLLSSCATSNERSIAEYLDFLDSTEVISSNTDLDNLLTTLAYVTSSQQLADALNTLHPASYSTLLVSQEQTILTLRDGIAERLDEIRTDTRAENECSLCLLHEWLAPIASFSRHLSQFGKSGYQGSMGGILGGFDLSFNECYTGGVGLGYTYTNVNWTTPHGGGNIETGYLGLYGQANMPKFFVDGSVMVGSNRFKGHRSIFVNSVYDTVSTKASGKCNGIQVDSYLGLGTSWSDCWGYGIDTTIIASIDWIYTHQQKMNETGAGGLDLVVQKKDSNLIRSSIGVLLSKEICNWVPEIGVSVLYYDRMQGGGKSQFRFVDQAGWAQVNGIYPSEWRAAPQASLTRIFCDGDISVQTAYSGEFSKDYLENDFVINIGFKF